MAGREIIMTAMQPQEILVREVFAAINNYDLATLQVLLAPDVVLYVPGHHVGAGAYRGYEGLLDFWNQMTRQARGNLEIRIKEVLCKTHQAAVIGTDVAVREGKRLEQPVVYVMRLEQGRVAEIWIHHHDQYAVDEFWR